MDNLNLPEAKQLVNNLLNKSKYKDFLVGISGGVDSLVLLSIINELKLTYGYNFRAIHINHNFSSNSNEMEKRCIDICNQYDVDLIVKHIQPAKTSNLEEYLREKRYEIFLNALSKNESLVLAHHLDDQVETFFYRLFRGSSPVGLSCMKKISIKKNKIIYRPLLSISKSIVINLAKQFNLDFVNDATNDNLKYHRNYIRKKIIPPIKKIWPELNQVMHHNILLQDQYNMLTNDYCIKIYNDIIINNNLEINRLKVFPEHIHTIFIKFWIEKNIDYKLSKNDLSNLLKIVNSNNNDYPRYLLSDKVITKYNNALYILSHYEKHSIKDKVWDLKNDIVFGNRKILIEKLKEKGIYDYLFNKAPITLKSFSGKEKILLNKNFSQYLKKVFQSNSIPTWERDRFILLFSQETLLVAYSENHIFISSYMR